jgi:hypothetical protein
MWLVDPQILCRSHLLGEHREMHALVGIVQSGKNLDGYLKNGLIETDYIKARHEELALEMLRRGYNHNSPLDYNDLDDPLQLGTVDDVANLQELRRRCAACKERIDA